MASSNIQDRITDSFISHEKTFHRKCESKRFYFSNNRIRLSNTIKYILSHVENGRTICLCKHTNGSNLVNMPVLHAMENRYILLRIF